MRRSPTPVLAGWPSGERFDFLQRAGSPTSPSVPVSMQQTPSIPPLFAGDKAAGNMSRVEEMLVELGQHLSWKFEQLTLDHGRRLDEIQQFLRAHPSKGTAANPNCEEADRPDEEKLVGRGADIVSFAMDAQVTTYDSRHDPDNDEKWSGDGVTMQQKYTTMDAKNTRRKSVATMLHSRVQAKEDGDVIADDLQNDCVQELEDHLAKFEVPSHKPQGRSPSTEPSPLDEEWVDNEGCCKRCYRRFCRMVRSSAFDYAIGAVIVMNTGYLGFQVDQQIQHHGSMNVDTQTSYEIIELSFIAVFALELVARIIVDRWRFPFSPWNMFDFMLVLFSAIDVMVKYGIGGARFGGALNVIRSFRMIKVFKTFRVIRLVRAFRELRVVVMSIIQCFRSLFWTVLLLFGLIYITAILILVELSDETEAFSTDTTHGQWRKQHFNELARAMLTLFQISTGGILWSEAAFALEPVTGGAMDFNTLLVLFVAIVVFAIANIMTGIFVDHAIKTALDDTRNVQEEEQEKSDRGIIQFRRCAFTMDDSGSGSMSRDTLQKMLQLPDMKQFLKDFDIDARDMRLMFDLICQKGKISLSDIDDFARDCLRVKGLAKNVEVVAINFKLKTLMRKQRLQQGMIENLHDTMQ